MIQLFLLLKQQSPQSPETEPWSRSREDYQELHRLLQELLESLLTNTSQFSGTYILGMKLLAQDSHMSALDSQISTCLRLVHYAVLHESVGLLTLSPHFQGDCEAKESLNGAPDENKLLVLLVELLGNNAVELDSHQEAIRDILTTLISVTQDTHSRELTHNQLDALQKPLDYMLMLAKGI
jgi:hypothetical protein